CQRTYAGVLIGEREARLALVRRQQIEAFEIENVAPAARYLAVGDAERARRDRVGEAGYRAAVEDAVAEIAEDDGPRPVGGDVARNLIGLRIGDAAVVDGVDLEQPIIAADESVLVRGRARIVDNRQDL